MSVELQRRLSSVARRLTSRKDRRDEGRALVVEARVPDVERLGHALEKLAEVSGRLGGAHVEALHQLGAMGPHGRAVQQDPGHE